MVLTLDDGYVDNLWNCNPLMEKHELPATVFVASGSVDNRGFWWDDLEGTLLQPKTLPKHLQMRVQDWLHEWPITSPDDRRLAYMAIHQILQPLKPSDRNQTIAELFAWAGVGANPFRPGRFGVGDWDGDRVKHRLD